MEQFEKAELSTEDFSKFMDIIDAQIKLVSFYEITFLKIVP